MNSVIISIHGWWPGPFSYSADDERLVWLYIVSSGIQKKFSAFSTFLVPAHLGSPGQRVVKRTCVCVCVCFGYKKKQLCTVSVTYCVSVCRWWMAKIAVRSAEVIYYEVLSIQSQSAPGAWIQDRSVSSFVTLFCFLSSVALLRSFAFYCVILSFISNFWHQFFSKPETVHQLLLIHVCVSWCCPIFPLPANVNVFWNSVICRWFYFFCC